MDEIYSDMRSVPTTVFALPENQKENLRKTIANLDEAASFLFPAYTCANACRAMLEIDTPESDSGISSIWSHDIGSNGYIQSKCGPIFQSILADPFSSISLTIISDLTNIAQQIAADIDYGLEANYYMRDENGAALQSAINELERCNCMTLSSHHSKIGKLCWYQDVSRDQVLALQKALNKIPELGTLTEDGVYGEKTSNIWNNFMDTLAHESFSSLTIINPLQTDLTGIRIQSFPKKKKVTPELIQNLPGSKLPDSYWQSFLFDGTKEGNQSLFYFNAPHGNHNYYHWNYHNSRDITFEEKAGKSEQDVVK